MEVVAAFACSHAGLIVTRRNRAAPRQRDAVYRAYAAVREEISGLRPDAVLIVATDHTKAFPFNHVPALTIGVGPSAKGLGDGGLPPCEIPSHQLFGKAILEGGIEQGLDLAFSEEVAVDHSFVMPLSLLTPDFDVPIVPLTQNCNVPPRPTFERSYEVGVRIRTAIDHGPGGRLV